MFDREFLVIKIKIQILCFFLTKNFILSKVQNPFKEDIQDKKALLAKGVAILQAHQNTRTDKFFNDMIKDRIANKIQRTSKDQLSERRRMSS